MDRKEFIKKGFLGTALFAATGDMAGVVKNKIDELKELEIIGFNHLPERNSKIMSNIVIHKSASRGIANHGWLQSRHTFSFANYYNPERMHFGVLRVLNDDIVDAGMGFSKHPHDNMEIITYVREGAITHRDSMGNVGRTEAGDVQVMSAGTGVQHSEHNLEDVPTRLYQIWIQPIERNVKPRWEARQFPKEPVTDKLHLLVSGEPEDGGDALFIHQYASISGGRLTQGTQVSHALRHNAYVLVSQGEVSVDGQTLKQGDGAEIEGKSTISIRALADAEVLVIDVP